MEGPKDPVAAAAPRRLLTTTDGVLLVVGMVVGAGIFKAPSIVAGNVASALDFALVWIAGGVASLCGALVYAELAGRFPEAGGEYRYLERAYGGGPSFVFAWSRMTVIQTGAIAAVAFVFGDYAQQIVSLGPKGSALYAGIAVLALTSLNVLGTPHSRNLQKALSAILVVALSMAVTPLLAMRGSPQEGSGDLQSDVGGRPTHRAVYRAPLLMQRTGQR